MAKSKPVSNTQVDPTFPHEVVTIGGKEYRLCFDFKSLAIARAHFRDLGYLNFNLLDRLGPVDVDTVFVLFPCAVHKFHPELSFEEAQDLLTLQVAGEVINALVKAWALSIPDPVKEAPSGNPSKP